MCVYDFRVQSETSRSPQSLYVQVHVYTYWSSSEQVLLEVAYIHERTCILRNRGLSILRNRMRSILMAGHSQFVMPFGSHGC